jgi:Mn2+/Fe2+ NRAMP family transporter
LSDDLDRRRRQARRRMAWVSFSLMVGTAVAILYGVVLSPERTDIADAIDVSSSVLNGLLTAFTTVVLGYLGVSVYERVAKRKED